jgi:hypothetical protein
MGGWLAVSCWFLARTIFSPEDGESIFHQNVRRLLTNNKISYPRNRSLQNELHIFQFLLTLFLSEFLIQQNSKRHLWSQLS